MLKKFFNYSRNQQRGIIVLVIIMVVFVIIYAFMPSYLERKYADDKDIEIEVIEKVSDSISIEDSASEAIDTLFYFNPNNVSADDLKLLGFSKAQAKALIAYRNAGAKFYSIKDFKRIYGVNEELIDRVGAYIVYDPKPVTITSKTNNIEKFNSESGDGVSIKALHGNEETRNSKTSHSNSIDNAKYAALRIKINIADTTDFKKLRGIGTVLARRIVKYRKALGGFYSIEQVKEVYGIKPEVYESIKDKLVLTNEASIKKIDIGRISAKQLSYHPYVSNENASKIINAYNSRSSKQDFIDFLKENDLERIQPYLKIME